jgi:hypothetical protein
VLGYSAAGVVLAVGASYYDKEIDVPIAQAASGYVSGSRWYGSESLERDGSAVPDACARVSDGGWPARLWAAPERARATCLHSPSCLDDFG